MKKTLFFVLLIAVMGTLFGQTGILPYAQNFDGESFPPPADDVNGSWIVRDRGGAGSWAALNGTAASSSVNVTPDDWLISPSFEFEDGESYSLEFDVKSLGTLGDNLSVYTMTSTAAVQCVDNNPNNTLLWSTTQTGQALTANWRRVVITLEPDDADIIRFISFRHHSSTNRSSVQIDNVNFFKMVAIDAGITIITGPSLYDPTLPFTATLRNFGSTAIAANAASVQFKGCLPGGAPSNLGAAITTHPEVAAGGSTVITVANTASWNLDVPTVTNYEFYAEATLANDEVPGNDRSEALIIRVFPASVVVKSTMDDNEGGTTNATPIQWYYRHSVSQTIFTPEELGGFGSYGTLFQIVLRFFDYNSNRQIPVQMYAANAPVTYTINDASSWYPYAQFTKVYDAPLPYTGAAQTTQDLTFEFGTGCGANFEDFVYEGGNLVIMMYKTQENYDSSSNVWWHNNGVGGVNRALYYYTDGTAPSVTNPPAGTIVGYYPKAMFYFNRLPAGTLSGTVTTSVAGNAPIPNATIYTTIFPAFSATTGTNGTYTLEGVPEGLELGFTAEAFGYYPATVQGSTITWTNHAATWSPEMTPLPSGLVISGRVKTSDSGDGVNDIPVSITGYGVAEGTETTTTTVGGFDGCFSFGGLYGTYSYTITASLPGYGSQTVIQPLTNSNVELDDITLQEKITKPGSVHAEIADNPAHVNLTWKNPRFGVEGKTFSYADYTVEDGLGNVSVSFDMIAVHKYTHDKLVEFEVNGEEITRIDFIPYTGFHTRTHTVMVWTTEDNTMSYPDGLTALAEVEAIDVVAESVNSVILPNPVLIPANGTLFIGLKVNGSEVGRRVAMDEDNFLQGLSDILCWDGAWQYTSDLGYPCAWNFYGHIGDPDERAGTRIIGYSPISSLDAPKPPRSRDITLNFNTTGAGMTVARPTVDITRGDTRVLNGEFEIYRMLAGSALPPDPLYTTDGSDVDMNDEVLSWVDTTWGSLGPGVYQYAVIALYYGAGYGGYQPTDPGYSNTLLKGDTVPVSVTVALADGGSLQGTIITFSNDNPLTPDQSGMLNTNPTWNTSLYQNVTYQLKVEKSGYGTYINRHIFMSQSANPVSISLIPIVEGFTQSLANSLPTGWLNLDVDGDSHAWKWNANNVGPGGSPTAFSESWVGDNQGQTGTPVNPNNWLITPPIDLANGTNILSFQLASHENTNVAYIGDRLLFYIAPDGTPPQMWQLFLDNISATNPNQEVIADGATLLEDHIQLDDEFYPLEYDISAYAGQTVRIAFRHAFCTDMWLTRLADVKIMYTDFTPITVTGRVVNAEGAPIPRVGITITSTPPVFVWTNNSGNFTATGVPGDATYTVFAILTNGPYADKVQNITVGSTNYAIGDIVMELGSPSPDVDGVVLPTVTALKANYPNPFNPSTTIAFDTHKEGRVAVDIYNIKGQKVKTLIDEMRGIGSHKVVWNGKDDTGRDVSSGIYFYRMQTEGYSSVKKMVLMK